MTALSVLIVLFDGPPVLFSQQRIGLKGKAFTVYKFRSMSKCRADDSTITVAGDSRVTRLGTWLRRLKLDELPQLFNVLKGDMSLVGPRPDVPGYMDKLQGEAAKLLMLRPGITGPATLAFRNEEALLARVANPQEYNDQVIFPEKVRINLQYLNSISLAMDLHYIIQTLRPSSTARPWENQPCAVYKHGD
jgi:lipopolysaccharide/colanic/teichoic acid biosynthesis glycosyltransferase